MLAAVAEVGQPCDILIAAAAVADYRPEVVAGQKMKKDRRDDGLTLRLVRNPDILATLAALRRQALHRRLRRRDRDLSTTPSQAGQQEAGPDRRQRRGPGRPGFNSDDNALTVFWPGGPKSYHWPQNRGGSPPLGLIIKKLPA